MLREKSEWIARFMVRLLALAPREPVGQLPEIAETHWFYLRYKTPEGVAEQRVKGLLPRFSREASWVDACACAIRELDPTMDEGDTRELAAQLWDADWAHAVDPYVMANALWDQAILMSRSGEAWSEHPLAGFLTRDAGRNS